MLANSPQTRLDITQTQQIARNCGLSLQTACKREVWGTASGGPYHWGGGWGGGYGTGDRDHIYQVLKLENTFVFLCNGPRPMPIIHYLVGDEHIQCQGMVPIPSQLCGGSPSQGLWILAWHEMNCVPVNMKSSSPRLSDFQFHCLNPAANRMNVDWDVVFVNQVR